MRQSSIVLSPFRASISRSDCQNLQARMHRKARTMEDGMPTSRYYWMYLGNAPSQPPISCAEDLARSARPAWTPRIAGRSPRRRRGRAAGSARGAWRTAAGTMVALWYARADGCRGRRGNCSSGSVCRLDHQVARPVSGGETAMAEDTRRSEANTAMPRGMLTRVVLRGGKRVLSAD